MEYAAIFAKKNSRDQTYSLPRTDMVWYTKQCHKKSFLEFTIYMTA